MSRAQFLSKLLLFFEMLTTMSSITINNYCKVQKMPIYGSMIPLNTFGTLELLFPISRKKFILVLLKFLKNYNS